MKCDYCHKEHDRRKFCSDYCKNEYHKSQKRKKNKAKLKSDPIEARNCDYCDVSFTPSRRCNEGQCFCSNKCKTDLHADEQRTKRKDIRGKTIRTCPICEKEFTPKHTMREKYCSARCCNLFPKKIYKALQTCYNYMGTEKRDHTRELLGYSTRQLQEHVQNHPNWPKVKDGDWHLDHVFPIIAFIEHGIKDVSLICCLENLQPLSGQGNCRKNRKYKAEEFRNWLRKSLDLDIITSC